MEQLETLLDRVMPRLRDDYVWNPNRLPWPTQSADIAELFKRYTFGTAIDRDAIRSRIEPGHEMVLLAKARGMANVAVREQSRERLQHGLIAVAMLGVKGHWKEVLVVLCLLYDSARRIGANPEDEFRKAADLADAATSKLILEYLDVGEKDISKMGYAIRDETSGFAYVPL